MDAHKAAPIPKFPPMTCPECAEKFRPRHGNQLFCTAAHTRAWHNRNMRRAEAIMPLMQAWRIGRHHKGDATAKMAFSDLCTMIDRANEEDRAAGRPSALVVLRGRYRRHGIIT